jgi:hypothetical protein
VSQVA